MKRIFIKANLCNGCKNCSVACMQAHRDTPGTVYDLDLTNPASESRNRILLNEDNQCIPLFCRHCNKPECVAACMSGAMTKDEKTGHVRYDATKCAACFMCVMSCPFGVPRPSRLPSAKVIKCDFCVGDNEEPNCVKACLNKAIIVKEV